MADTSKAGHTQMGVGPYIQQTKEAIEKKALETAKALGRPVSQDQLQKLIQAQTVEAQQAVIEAPRRNILEQVGIEMPDYVTINQKKLREDAALERGRELKKKVEETNRQINFFKTKQEEYEAEMLLIARGLGLEQSSQSTTPLESNYKWIIAFFIIAILNIALSSVLVNFISPIKNPSVEISDLLVNCNNSTGNTITCNEKNELTTAYIGLHVFVQSGTGDIPLNTVITSVPNKSTFVTNNAITGLSNTVLLVDNTWIKKTSTYSISLLIVGLMQLVAGIWFLYKKKNESVIKAWLLIFSAVSIGLLAQIPTSALPYNLKISYGFQIVFNSLSILGVSYEIFTGLKELWPLLFG